MTTVCRVCWTWTGTQRLFAPDVQRFDIYQKLARRKEEETPDRQEEQEWERSTTIPPLVALLNDIVEQDAAAGPLELVRVTHRMWAALQGNHPSKQKGIRWLPEPAPDMGDPVEPNANQKRSPHALLWQVRLPVTRRLERSSYRLAPEDASVDSFVPGALVAYNEAEDAQSWQHYQVMWHEWNERTGWTLYIVQNHPGGQKINSDDDATMRPMPPRLRFPRFYPGQRYEIQTQLNRSPEFVIKTETVGTVAYEIGVRAVAVKGAETLESEMGVPAAVVAVDRRRPPAPLAPRVEIAKADYYGKSRRYCDLGKCGRQCELPAVPSSGRARLRRAISSSAGFRKRRTPT